MVEFPWRRHSLRSVLDIGSIRGRAKTKMDFCDLRERCCFDVLARVCPTLEPAPVGTLSSYPIRCCFIRFIICLERFSRILYRWIDRIYCLAGAGGLVFN